MNRSPCEECEGTRLRKEARFVKVGDLPIHKLTGLAIRDAHKFFSKLELSARDKQIAERILREITDRLTFLVNVGLDYLTLDRTSATLSGGEAQRIRLATQIGSSLVGVLYILDEPSIGLHQRDNDRLLQTLRRLRDIGNTVIVVEHDEDTIRAADHVVDMGPRAGVHGGRIVASGTPEDIIHSTASLTGAYLSGRKKIDIPRNRRQPGNKYITIKGARAHNLHNLTVRNHVGVLTAVTGVSLSGKSSLVFDPLLPALQARLNHSKSQPGKHDSVDGLHHVDKVIDIDQSPIGRTPRSNPATYTGVFTHIRDLFAALPESKTRGYKAGRYSFNVKGGRCEACQGDGILRIEMHFLPDIYVTCEQCLGRRYNRETLEVKYKGASIADVLDMTVTQAAEFLQHVPKIRQKLETLRDVGLGYIHLGQAATTLSGGEAQRIKLSKELAKKGTGRTVYILDEPTTGLHFDDIKQLLAVLNSLVEQGNTVIVIEHNLDVIKTADYVIDLGPEGGDGGGNVVASGTPEDVARANGFVHRPISEESDVNALRPWEALLCVLAALTGLIAMGPLLVDRLGLLGITLSELGFVALPTVGFLQSRGLPPVASLGLSRARLGAVAGGILCGAGGFWLVALLEATVLERLLPVPEAVKESLRRLVVPGSGPRLLFLDVVALALTPALCEEALFRGLALPSLRPRLGTAGAVAVTALLFAGFHLLDLSLRSHRAAGRAARRGARASARCGRPSWRTPPTTSWCCSWCAPGWTRRRCRVVCRGSPVC